MRSWRQSAGEAIHSYGVHHDWCAFLLNSPTIDWQEDSDGGIRIPGVAGFPGKNENKVIDKLTFEWL
jgi:hypothetical protein